MVCVRRKGRKKVCWLARIPSREDILEKAIRILLKKPLNEDSTFYNDCMSQRPHWQRSHTTDQSYVLYVNTNTVHRSMVWGNEDSAYWRLEKYNQNSHPVHPHTFIRSYIILQTKAVLPKLENQLRETSIIINLWIPWLLLR